MSLTMSQRFDRISSDFLAGFFHRIEVAVSHLSEEQVWWRPNAATNSVGNLLLHLQGNLSQWILASLGGEGYERHRSREFTADRTARKAELLDGLGQVVERCRAVIDRLSAEQLAQRRKIQGYDTDGIYAVFHVVEHMSYHTGQIVHIVKELKGAEARIEFFPQHRNE
jgi:uncharacterized damage-inducible protein DinB